MEESEQAVRIPTGIPGYQVEGSIRLAKDIRLGQHAVRLSLHGPYGGGRGAAHMDASAVRALASECGELAGEIDAEGPDDGGFF